MVRRLSGIACSGMLFGISICLWPASLAAQEEFICLPRLVSCNYAEFYSGTLHRYSVLQAQGDKQAGGMVSIFTEDLTVEVKDGRAVCKGTVQGFEESWYRGRAEARRRRGGTIQGGGQLAVELGVGIEDSPEQPWVRISIACPTAAGQDTLEDLLHGGPGKIQTFASEPPELDRDGVGTGEQPTAADHRVLKGSTSEEALKLTPSTGSRARHLRMVADPDGASPCKEAGPVVTGRDVRRAPWWKGPDGPVDRAVPAGGAGRRYHGHPVTRPSQQALWQADLQIRSLTVTEVHGTLSARVVVGSEGGEAMATRVESCCLSAWGSSRRPTGAPPVPAHRA